MGAMRCLLDSCNKAPRERISITKRLTRQQKSVGSGSNTLQTRDQLRVDTFRLDEMGGIRRLNRRVARFGKL
jgi:hypothetical protein